MFTWLLSIMNLLICSGSIVRRLSLEPVELTKFKFYGATETDCTSIGFDLEPTPAVLGF